jgi:hypothetical protein
MPLHATPSFFRAPAAADFVIIACLAGPLRKFVARRFFQRAIASVQRGRPVRADLISIPFTDPHDVRAHLRDGGDLRLIAIPVCWG